MRHAILFILFSTFLFNAIGQIDSLNGFDEKAVLNDLRSRGANLSEMNCILRLKKIDFIKNKFNLPKVPVSSPYLRKSSNSNGQNIDFEAGNLTGWSIFSGINVNSLEMPDNSFQNSGGTASVVSGGFDPIVGIPLNSPLGGNWVVQVNTNVPYGKQTKLRNKIKVTESTNLLKFAYATVLNSAYHDCDGQPYFAVLLKDTNNNLLFKYIVEAHDTLSGPNYCWGHNQTNFLLHNNFNYFSNWATRCVDLTPYIGDDIYIEVIGAGCYGSIHYGYGYFDAKLESCPEYGYPNILTINNYTVDLSANYLEYNNPVCDSLITLVAPNWPQFYNWNGAPKSGIYASPNQSISVRKNGIHTLALSNGSSCPITKTMLLKPYTNDEIVIGTLSPWCENTEQTLWISGPRSFTINNTFPIYSPVYGLYTIVTPTATGVSSLNIAATSSAGCVFLKTYTYNVAPLPTLAVTGNSVYCNGSQITLSASGATSYYWSSLSSSLAFTASGAVITASSLPGNIVQLTGTGPTGCQSKTICSVNVQYIVPPLPS
ncbi:MAG: hypothetical protein IT236_02445, partial [Bacteroidia bacterium]|nr:hypothetical protein [Bacteroidia bacterium]